MTRYLFAVIVFLSACKAAASQPEPLRPDELARLDEFKRCLDLGYNNGLVGRQSAEAFCNAEAVRRALLEVK